MKNLMFYKISLLLFSGVLLDGCRMREDATFTLMIVKVQHDNKKGRHKANNTYNYNVDITINVHLK